MSYRNGHTNGAYGSNRYTDDRREESPAGSRQRRAGGYGGFYDGPPSAPPEPEPQQPPASFRRRPPDDFAGGFGHFASGRRDTDDYSSSRSRDRGGRGADLSKLHGGGPGRRQIEDILAHINESWDIMTSEDCVPVHIALQLMDYSSLGRGNDYQDFQKTSKYLQKALKAIVNEHHQGFNSSIGTFHSIQASIQTSQNRVRALKDSVHGAKTNLMVTKPELKALGSSSQHYDDMLQVLGQIEKLQLIPEQLDARISDKHFLPAVDLLQNALRMIRRPEMENIGALTDLRIYFSNQETSLTDILIEELHDHLYLKSPYCQDRWKPYTGDKSNQSAAAQEAAALPNTWGRPLYRFLDNLDASKPLEDEVSQSPEADSFHYIHVLMESLNKLGHLDATVDRLEQRLPIELFAIVDRTNMEVDLRHGSSARATNSLEAGSVPFVPDKNLGRSDVLDDLLWTLYSKFEAIAEGHRAVHEVVSGIVKRDGIGQSRNLTRGFQEMWKLYQSEIRSLLHHYLATDGSQAYRLGRQPAADGNMFQKNGREKNKRVFKLSDIDLTSADLAKDQRDLDQILQTSVPGLVSKSQRRSGVPRSSVGQSHDGPPAGHKLLVDPNVFNIGSLLPPSLSFLQRLKDIVPHDAGIAMSTLTSFLDEFLINVFHPQLEDTVTELCTQCLADLEAFQPDSQWTQHASQPIFKGSYTFFFLIKSFCHLLDTIPPDLTSTQLIITQILAYYDKCCQWYRMLVRRPKMQEEGDLPSKPAAVLADSADLRDVCRQMYNVDANDSVDAAVHQEVSLLLAKTDASSPEPNDIISDRRSVTTLCLIHNSMEWLASKLQGLRRLVPEAASHKRNNSQKSLHARQLSLFTNTNPQDENAPVYLPMTPESASAFDSILASIRELGTTALFTLHLDIRLGVIHMLARTMSAHYLLAQPAQDPDPSILSLNADLLSTVDTLSTHLAPSARHFIVHGLAVLIDIYLVAKASRIEQGMNTHGCGRMQLNILVLSQNLKSIESSSSSSSSSLSSSSPSSSPPTTPAVPADSSADLIRAGQYYDLFLEGAASVVSRAKDQAGAGLEGFDLEELKTLLELWYREGTLSGVREVQVKSQRDLSDQLLVLSECLWNR